MTARCRRYGAVYKNGCRDRYGARSAHTNDRQPVQSMHDPRTARARPNRTIYRGDSRGDAMPLTPEDVANKQFTSTRLKPGYDETEVDEFLDEVEAELTRLYRENDELRSKSSTAPAPACRRRCGTGQHDRAGSAAALPVQAPTPPPTAATHARSGAGGAAQRCQRVGDRHRHPRAGPAHRRRARRPRRAPRPTASSARPAPGPTSSSGRPTTSTAR